MNIRFKKLHKDSISPCKARTGDAGWDLSLYFARHEFDIVMCHTGIAVEIPDGFFGLLRPRSSISKTCYSFESSGIIDSGYRGELIVPFRFNPESGLAKFSIGDRIAQIIFLQLPFIELVESEQLSETDRGTGGFGSTNNKP